MHLFKSLAAVATAALFLPGFGGTGGIGLVGAASVASVGEEVRDGGENALRGIEVSV